MAAVVVELLGAAAAALTTLSFIPQAAHVLRTRETGAISLTMYAMFTMGVVCWGLYGLMTMQWSIIIANVITVSLASLILFMKLRDVLRARRTGGA